MCAATDVDPAATEIGTAGTDDNAAVADVDRAIPDVGPTIADVDARVADWQTVVNGWRGAVAIDDYWPGSQAIVSGSAIAVRTSMSQHAEIGPGGPRRQGR